MKVGVIGLGFMGAAHVNAIINYPKCELAAIASRNPKTLSGDFTSVGGNLKLKEQHFDFDHVKKFTDWRELVEDTGIEALSVCLPTALHEEVVVAALDAGKHVLCEKPMALTLTDCQHMLESSEAAKKTLMIGHVLRFWPEYLALGKFVHEDTYGKIRQATFTRRCGIPDWSAWQTDPIHSGGAIFDLLIHDIDQILLLFGMPDRVTAKRLGDTDALMASFIYPGGPEVRLHGGWFAPGMPFSMSFQVLADKARMELTPDGLTISDLAGIRNKVALNEVNAYEEEMHYFIDCCESNLPVSQCPPNQSAAAVKLALALEESRSRDGEQIKCLV